jgi:dTDP-glucose 4,6-dehydratase
LLAQQGKPGEHYLIGDQNESSNLVLVESLCDLLENIAPEYKPPHLAHYKELITFVPDRPGHDRRYAVDATKIRQTLGWKANKSFERGLQETLQWYLKNSAWWRPLVSGDYKLQRQGIKY